MISEAPEKSTMEEYLDYIQNSSLFIFHQNNCIRQWCQRCIINEPEEDPDKKLKQQMAALASGETFTDKAKESTQDEGSAMKK